MLFDLLHELRSLVEAPASSRLKRVEGEVDCLKRGLKALTDDANEKLEKLKRYTLDSALESAETGYIRTLNEWTGKSTAIIVYESTVDEFMAECLFQAIKGKPNVAIIATTTDGDVFGGFYSVAVKEQDEFFYDPDIFIFSFESRGRCTKPQRFDVRKKAKADACVAFFNENDSDGCFVDFDGGCGELLLGNEKSNTWCSNLSDCFEGLEDTTLTGTNRPEKFTCCRLVAIQLEKTNFLW